MPGTVKKLQFSEGTDVGAPTDLSLQTSTSVIKAYADDASYVADQAAQEGSVYLNTTLNKFRMYIGSAWRNAVPESDSADATKRFLIDLTGNTTGTTATLDFNTTSSRVYTFPDATFTVVGVDTTQTLTNKTLTAPLLDLPVIKSNAGVGLINANTPGDALNIGTNAGNMQIGQSSSTVTIPGNLTVQGTTTTIDTTNTTVKDANIIINNGGNNASAEGAGLTIDRTGTDGSLVYEDALTSKFKAGALGSEIELVNVSSNQTLTNKRIHSHTTSAANDSTSPRVVLPQNTYANLQTISGANHPNEGAVYWATDIDKAYVWDGSSLVALGSGAGSGEINYVTNPDAETNVSSVNAYADAAASTPVDGTGGSPNVTVTRNTTTPIRGNADFALAKDAANRQGQGWAWDLGAVSIADRSKKLKLQFDYDFTDSNYVSGDVTVFIYDITNTTLITPQNNSVAKSSGTHTATWDATTSSSYRAIFHVATTNASAYTLKVDNIVVGPGYVAKAAAVSDWQSFTPTLTGFGTATSLSFFWRRCGSSVDIRGFFNSGAPSGVIGTMTLPNSWSVDTTFNPGNRGGNYGAYARLASASTSIATADYIGNMTYDSTSGATVLTFQSRGAGNTYNNNNANSLFSNGEGVAINITNLPISQLSGSGVVNTLQEDNLTPWTSYTPTFTGFGTAANIVFRWRRVGSEMEIRGNFQAGTVTAVAGYFTLPSGKTIDTAELNGSAANMLGEYRSKTGIVSDYFVANASGGLAYDSGVGTGSLGFARGNNAADNYGFPNVSAFISNSAYIDIVAKVPIAEWRSAPSPLVGFSLATSGNSGLAPVGVFNNLEQAVVNLQEKTTTPTDPSSGSECKIYMKADKFVIQYNDAGTVRYKYLDLTGTGVTWVHTTSAP